MQSSVRNYTDRVLPEENKTRVRTEVSPVCSLKYPGKKNSREETGALIASGEGLGAWHTVRKEASLLECNLFK